MCSVLRNAFYWVASYCYHRHIWFLPNILQCKQFMVIILQCRHGVYGAYHPLWYRQHLYLILLILGELPGLCTGPTWQYIPRDIVIADFTTLGRSHLYCLPCPSADSLDLMDLYYTLMFQYYPQKSHVYTYTQLVNPYSRVYITLDLKPAYIGMCP